MKKMWFVFFLNALVVNANGANALAQTPPPHLFVTDAPGPQTLTSRFGGGGVLVQATIAGKPYWFELDSGTNGMILDAGVAHDLKLPRLGTNRADVADLDVGPLHAKNVRFWLTDYGNGSDPRVVGILGSPFFRSTIVRIDYRNRTVTVFPAASFDPATAGTPLPVEFHANVGFFDVSIDGKPGKMLLDTGSFATFVFTRFARGMNFGPPLGDPQPLTLGIGGVPAMSAPYYVPLTVAGNDLKNAVVYVSTDTRPFAGPFYAAGVFGRDLQSQFALTLDWRDNEVFFLK